MDTVRFGSVTVHACNCSSGFRIRFRLFLLGEIFLGISVEFQQKDMFWFRFWFLKCGSGGSSSAFGCWKQGSDGSSFRFGSCAILEMLPGHSHIFFQEAYVSELCCPYRRNASVGTSVILKSERQVLNHCSIAVAQVPCCGGEVLPQKHLCLRFAALVGTAFFEK